MTDITTVEREACESEIKGQVDQDTKDTFLRVLGPLTEDEKADALKYFREQQGAL